MNVFQRIIMAIQASNDDIYVKKIDELNSTISGLNSTLKFKEEEITKSIIMIDGLQNTVKEQTVEIDEYEKIIFQLQSTELDDFCKANYARIANIAYKDKMKFLDKYYDVYLNEIITPNAFEVLKLKHDTQSNEDRLIQMRIYGDKVSSLLTWTDDANLDKSGDLYLYPAQSIAYKKCDCEDHAYLTASMDIELGVAYGFYYPETVEKNPNNKFGHAFNVFIYKGELYILETTGNTGTTEKYTGKKHYTINYIITRKNTYMLDGKIRFGELAGWN